jgi:hypothetical protein
MPGPTEGLKAWSLPPEGGAARRRDVLLRERQALAGGYRELEVHEVQPHCKLRNWVLDLQAGVHLQEVKLLAFNEELDRSGVDVAGFVCQAHRGVAHLLPQVFREGGRGGLLDYLLVPPLNRALPLV